MKIFRVAILLPAMMIISCVSIKKRDDVLWEHARKFYNDLSSEHFDRVAPRFMGNTTADEALRQFKETESRYGHLSGYMFESAAPDTTGEYSGDGDAYLVKIKVEYDPPDSLWNGYYNYTHETLRMILDGDNCIIDQWDVVPE